MKQKNEMVRASKQDKAAVDRLGGAVALVGEPALAGACGGRADRKRVEAMLHIKLAHRSPTGWRTRRPSTSLRLHMQE